jgi:hypothetical protein
MWPSFQWTKTQKLKNIWPTSYVVEITGDITSVRNGKIWYIGQKIELKFYLYCKNFENRFSWFQTNIVAANLFI